MSMQNEKFPYAGAIDADGHILEPPDRQKVIGDNVAQVYGI